MPLPVTKDQYMYSLIYILINNICYIQLSAVVKIHYKYFQGQVQFESIWANISETVWPMFVLSKSFHLGNLGIKSIERGLSQWCIVFEIHIKSYMAFQFTVTFEY